MKKLLIFCILAFSGCNLAFCQTIKHHNYTTYYNAATKEPDSVKWTLTPAMLNCSTHLARTNKFIADPQIPGTKFNADYERSGYDQGHQFPAQDASCNTTDETECFYFSNMVPQLPNLNRITWKALEAYTRKLASKYTVYVTCGVFGSLGHIGKDKINIPAQCWKRLKYGNITEYYVMPNADTVKKHPFTYYKLK
jgi:endonuclease G, mitochondrial